MALTPPLPTPLPAFSSSIILAPDVSPIGLSNLYTNISTAGARNELQWRKVAIAWTRTPPAGTVEDTAVIAFHVAKIVAGQLNTVWSTADMTAVETQLNTFLTGLQPFMSTSHVGKDYRWYTMSFSDMAPMGGPVNAAPPLGFTFWERFNNSGPPVRVQPLALSGTATGAAMPFQDAASITLRTPGPKHWGRVYIPGLVPAAMDATVPGRFVAALTTALANGTQTLISNLASNAYFIVVPHTQFDSKFNYGLSLPNKIQVDDVPDVIRRRRGKHAARRTTLP